ncbi:Ribosomal protein S3, eukaryotic/archaeal [Carpediemonas membranifera]|nr:Ribosomal protein S3 eukaryotic/archaeal [Carpediemonas membranifera]KAG9391226.1 Ribosomal protein S3, eukaryotic/archaeal [Carpediemonas membranifera]|eukprot:KAG9390098.1 Ribosomal protein S3 eukaryotic/archaeal [Carpediemonas membranifera]
MVQMISKKHKAVADGLFYAELNEFLRRELAAEGYSGCEVKRSPMKTDIVIRATKTREVLGTNNRRLRELTSLIQKRYGFKDGAVELFCDRVMERGLSASAQAESLRFKLEMGLPVRRAAYSVMRSAMEAGAKGVEIVVSGKLRAARAKSQKYRDGYILRTGQPGIDYVDTCTTALHMRQGVLGIQVKICLPTSRFDKNAIQPDLVTVLEPKEE